jgi:hypothetical protein
MIQIPTIGSRIRVRTEYSDGKTFVKEGTVVPSIFKNPTIFALETGNPSYPVSEISMPYVKEIQLLSGKFSSYSTDSKFWKVKSKKSGGLYLVSYISGKFTCTCKGFVFRRDCRHIGSVSKK